MQDEYQPDLVTLSDDNGKEYNFEVLDAFEDGEIQYVALTPYNDGEKNENTVELEDDGSLVIMKVVPEGDDNIFLEIEDDDEYERVANEFVIRLQDYYEIDEQ